MLRVIVVYSGDFGKRVIRNLINDPDFCKACGSGCINCKDGLYSYAENVSEVVELREPRTMPAFIEETSTYFPRELPSVDLCLATGIHKDLLLDLPHRLSEAGIKALIVPVEDHREVPPGLQRQVEGACKRIGVECAFPKPFCSLVPPKEKPIISRFVNELKVGKPLVDVETEEARGKKVITNAIVKRSAPCGSTWFVARKLVGVELNRRKVRAVVADAHHSYPCTASMETDPELGDTILHRAGYLIREAVERALGWDVSRLKEVIY